MCVRPLHAPPGPASDPLERSLAAASVKDTWRRRSCRVVLPVLRCRYCMLLAGTCSPLGFPSPTWYQKHTQYNTLLNTRESLRMLASAHPPVHLASAKFTVLYRLFRSGRGVPCATDTAILRWRLCHLGSNDHHVPGCLLCSFRDAAACCRAPWTAAGVDRVLAVFSACTATPKPAFWTSCILLLRGYHRHPRTRQTRRRSASKPSAGL